MEKALLYTVVASALCTELSLAARQYYFIYDPKNWIEAQSYCREKYTDLATIKNMEDVNILNNMANLSSMVYPVYSHQAWIGLYDDVSTWKWSMSDQEFYRGGEMDFRNWATGEPNGNQNLTVCAMMGHDGLWADALCDDLYNVICSNIKGSNVTFVYISANLNWRLAKSYCQQHHTDLASVRNMSETQKIKDLIPVGQVAWIGLFRDTWKWSDGSYSSFRYLRDGEPNNSNEECGSVIFDVSGRWEHLRCDLLTAFICYSEVMEDSTTTSWMGPTATMQQDQTMTPPPPPPTPVPASKRIVRLKLEKSSSLDVNNPAVLEEVLKKLKDQGMSADIKLSWKKRKDGNIFHKKKKETEKKNSSKNEL